MTAPGTGLQRATQGARRAGLALLLACTGCAADVESAPPSLLLISIDTLRADAVSAWGRERGTTPVIDSLAARGTRFAQATSVTPLTLPTHVSIFTGLRPARHGLTVNGVSRETLPVPTLAERLAERGHVTGGFVSSTVLDRRHGVAAGFAHWDDTLHVPGGPPVPTERRAGPTVDAALAWPGWDQSRFFAFVHLFDPHAPYDAPGGATGLGRDAYLDEVRHADRELGRLLAAVSARVKSPVLVVLLSDHGESLGEHGEETHGLLLTQGSLHVPLVMAWLDGSAERGFPEPGVVREDAVSLLDVLPTLEVLLDLPAQPGLDGRPVVVAQPGRPLPVESRAPWFYYGFSPLAGVRRDAELLVAAPRAQPPGFRLHDLVHDPGGTGPGHPAPDHPLAGAVRSPDPAEEAHTTGDRDALETLGYFGSDPREDGGQALPDPRERMALIVVLDRANTALVEGRPEEALARLLALDEIGAAMPEAQLLLARAERALGQPDAAAARLAVVIERRPTAALRIERGAALLAAGTRPHDAVRLTEAAAELDRALALDPQDSRAISLRVLADLELGQVAAASARARVALQSRPRSIELLTAALRAARQAGHADEVRDLRARLSALWPQHPELAEPPAR